MITTKGKGRSSTRRKFTHDKPRSTVTCRIRTDMYERLKSNAEVVGLSVSEEIERRLDLSLHMAADPIAAAALRVIGENWRAIQIMTGQNMQSSEFVRKACASVAKESVLILSDLQMTKEDSSVRSLLSETFAGSLGRASSWLSFMLQCEIDDTERLEHFRKNVIDGLLASRVEHEKKVAQPASVDELAGRLAGPVETFPVRGHPSELFGRADYDEARGPNRSGDPAPPDPVEPAPAPTKRKKAKAGA